MTRSLFLAAATVGLVCVATARAQGTFVLSRTGQPDGQARTVVPVDDPWMAHIDQTMMQLTSCAFDATPLREAADYFAQRHGISIVFDRKGLSGAEVSEEEPVTLKLTNVTFRSALGLILGQLDLDWYSRDGVLVITTAEVVNDVPQKIRVYPVGDLVYSHDGVPDYDSLIELITSKVRRTSWAEVGGPADIGVYGGTLVISQSEQVHWEIAGLLEALRKTAQPTTAQRAVRHARPNDIQEEPDPRRANEPAVGSAP